MPSTLIVALGFSVVVIGCVIYAKLKDASFKKRFPPISDAEFLARCTPGTDPKVALRVRRIVAENLGIEEARIYPSSRFVGDLE